MVRCLLFTDRMFVCIILNLHRSSDRVWRSSERVGRRSDSSVSACCKAGPGSIYLGVHELVAKGLEPLGAVILRMRCFVGGAFGG
jgi:hypothetical protein